MLQTIEINVIKSLGHCKSYHIINSAAVKMFYPVLCNINVVNYRMSYQLNTSHVIMLVSFVMYHKSRFSRRYLFARTPHVSPF
jgi:hypothetical protein